MKIVQADRLDSIADYRLVDAADPVPGSGEVCIETACVGVGYVDALTALGGYQVKPPLPNTPGGEIAGRVVAVGDGVTGFVPGDRVMAVVRGGFAQRALAAAGSVLLIPDSMSFAQACGFRVNYLTALHGLVDRAGLQAGERLLVLGAAGGVGLAAVQIGSILGAEVLAAASTPEKRAFALAGGAAQALDTATEGWRDRLKAAGGGKGPDVVFDPLCGPLFEPTFRSLSWRGRHLVVGFVGGPIPALGANLTLMKGAALTGVDVRQFGLFEPERAGAHMTRLLAWVAEGRLTPPVGREFAFTDFAAALQFALSGKGLGKTVLRVAGD